MMQELARYWAADYDWRKCEAKLNALPQFMTEIDGLDIHFIHVRSDHENALPLIVTHGWPGSVIEQLKIIDPLTNPTAHGASASDAFHLVIPSMPGYGFSGKPTATGWDPARIARAWVVLMERLGYTQFLSQGGDWGGAITNVMGTKHLRNCSAFTSTSQPRFRPTSPRRSSPATRRQPACQPAKDAHTSS
jgi:pimeloyl-ACP methyl ester carboxylesterase